MRGRPLNLPFFTAKYAKHAKEFAVSCMNGLSMKVRINAHPSP